MSGVMGRRQFLGAVLGTAVPSVLLAQGDAAQDSAGAVGELRYRSTAGVFRGRITDMDNDPGIIALEKRLRCMCGCNQDIYQCRTTDFTCPLWPQTHPRIVAMVEGGMTADEVVAEFVAESGEEVLMAPVREGFNLAGYFLPGTLILLVGSTIAWVLARRTRPHPALEASATALSDEEQQLLRSELEKLEI